MEEIFQTKLGLLEDQLISVESFYYYQSRRDRFDGTCAYEKPVFAKERIVEMQMDFFLRLHQMAQRLQSVFYHEENLGWNYKEIYNFVESQFGNKNFIESWANLSENEKRLWLLRRLFRRKIHFGGEEFNKKLEAVESDEEAQTLLESYLTSNCVLRAMFKLHESPLPYWKEKDDLQQRNKLVVSRREGTSPIDFWKVDEMNWFKGIVPLCDLSSWNVLQAHQAFEALKVFQGAHLQAAQTFSEILENVESEPFQENESSRLEQLQMLSESSKTLEESAFAFLEAARLVDSIYNTFFDDSSETSFLAELEKKALEKLST
jgi:hypothetical protein